MKYTPLPKELYQRNRAKFAAKMAKNGVAIFNANDILPTNADGTMKFRQNNDLFYLCGIDQEETILLLAPDCPNPAWREVLFLRETNAHIAVWEGHKYTKEEAFAASGIGTILWLTEFDLVFNSVVNLSETIYLNTNEHLRAGVVVETRDARFIKMCKEKHPLHAYERSAPILHDLRGVKEPEEIQQLQIACDITEKGFRRVLGMVKPGVTEYEIECVVVGLPLHMNGNYGDAAKSAVAEVQQLTSVLSVPVLTFDERRTTVTADNILIEQNMNAQERRKVIDKVAAAVMLQSWLDGRKMTESNS